MLEIQNLEVFYGRVNALKGVSLEAHEGEFLAVLGPNGAGKSTLLAAVTGQVAPRRGTIKFEGTDILGRTPDQIVKRGIALVPEGRRIFASLSVEENLKLAQNVRGDTPEFREGFGRMLERFPILDEYRATPAGKLSGGEQQQLAIARALLCQPRLLVLDEPSLGLAPRVVDDLFKLLTELHAEGLTILLVEQNAMRALEIVNRAYVLNTGRVVWAGESSALREGENLADTYLGSPI